MAERTGTRTKRETRKRETRRKSLITPPERSPRSSQLTPRNFRGEGGEGKERGGEREGWRKGEKGFTGQRKANRVDGGNTDQRRGGTVT